jgi:hypothetical protein
LLAALDKFFKVAVGEAIARLLGAVSDIDVFQLAAADEAANLLLGHVQDRCGLP